MRFREEQERKYQQLAQARLHVQLDQALADTSANEEDAQ